MAVAHQKDIVEEVVSFLFPKVSDGTIIDGGHYLVEEVGGEVKHLCNAESELTFRVAVALYKKAKGDGRHVALAFLVGDLSVSSDRRKNFNENFTLPSSYLEILKRYSVTALEVQLFFESTLRNKAAKKIKTAVKEGSVVEVDRAYRMNVKEFGVFCDDQISSANTDPTKRVPVCRMLIAQQLLDKEFNGFSKAINFCNADVYKCMGRYASVYQFLLSGSMEVINFYFAKNEEGLHVFGDVYSGSEQPERIFEEKWDV